MIQPYLSEIELQTPVRTGILETSPTLRNDLQQMIQSSTVLECTGVWNSVNRFPDRMDSQKVEVILVDVESDYKRKLLLLEQVTHAGIKAVALVNPLCDSFPSPHKLIGKTKQILTSGAKGLVFKNADWSLLEEAILSVNQGEVWVEHRVAMELLKEQWSSSRSEVFLSHSLLTPREKEVVRLISKGMSNQEISSHLNTKLPTIKNQVSTILSKLQLRDRTQLALYAIQSRL